MLLPPQTSTLFPYTTLFRSTASARNNRFAIRTFVKAVQSLFQIWSQIAINITGTMPQSERINKHCWVIRDVIVKVGPSVEVEWVLAKESTRRRAVVETLAR